MENKPVLLIDDECVLCNKTVNFIIRNGGEGKFEFLSLYSERAKKLLNEKGLPEDYKESVVLIEGEKLYLKSNAVLKVTEKLEGIVKILSWSKILPSGLRDGIYDMIAKHRHKIV
ncbi:MAG: thiol-disulfide oxidoreductase DCC family protein [Bacteroidota bacterium]